MTKRTYGHTKPGKRPRRTRSPWVPHQMGVSVAVGIAAAALVTGQCPVS
jgi:hypothetical protein